MSYVLEYYGFSVDGTLLFGNLPEFFEKMPAMESISRCKRKLALKDEIFRPDNKEVIESRLNQTNEILESVKD